jgi:threonine dehydratase
MSTVTLASIEAARTRIRDVIYHSPCPYSLSLSRLCGCEIYCKLDHLQMTGSFKERGARNKLLQLTDAEKSHGVIAASAGNHAQALAYHGRELRVRVTVVMPVWAPLVKITNCRQFGANVVLHGDTYDAARAYANQLASEQSLVYVPGFDDPDIIAGQGTLGLEILEDVPDPDVVIVPVGGGGLIAGVARAIKSVRPQTRIIGVESEHAPTLKASLAAGKVTRIETQPTLADGLAVAEIGKLCFEMARELVDDLVMVDEAQIATSILRLLELEKMVVEGAGAVSLAAAMSKTLGLEGKKIVLLLSGGNIDVTILSKIIERGLAADGRLCRLTASITDRPGGLAKIAALIAATGASVKDISHDRHFGPADISDVNVHIVLETRDFDHIAQIKHSLMGAGFVVQMDE